MNLYPVWVISRMHPIEVKPQKPIEHDRVLDRQRHKIENLFGRLKDWRRIHTRYDRCAPIPSCLPSASQRCPHLLALINES